MSYPAAKLTARWEGRQVGTLVIGSNATRVLRAGIATKVTLTPLEIHTTPHTDGGHDDGQDRTAGTDGPYHRQEGGSTEARAG